METAVRLTSRAAGWAIALVLLPVWAGLVHWLGPDAFEWADD